LIKAITSLTHYTDDELLKLMTQDHREAFNEIYERYSVKLYLTAFKRLRSEDDAKDMVQDLFLSLWLKRQSITIKTSLSAYLYTAVKHKVINYAESNIVRGNYLNSLNKTLIEYDNSTHDTIVSRDLEQHIDFGIDRLSPKMKMVFELSRRENLSVNEIADRLQLSEQTVKNQISKALKILRVHVSDISAGILLLVALAAG
jgi:RNA polymerase sigma-70 factor (family 1)